MTDQTDVDEEETKRLVVAITDFLRDQLIIRTDLVPEDRDSLQIAIECLEMAYDLEGRGYIQHRNYRSLLDIFCQVTNPVSVKDKIQADAHKEEGNNYMKRRMFENAESEYTNAINLDKWNSIYYCNRAGARIELRNYFNAIADCRYALMLNPDYAKAHARMGQAYALLHRPREAARCFRQALELEPENERYRNNLRVAESEIERPDISQFITSLLGSLLGVGSQNAEAGASRTMPPSFMIITESHPPIPGGSPQTVESALNRERSQNAAVNRTDTQEDESSIASANGINNITFPRPFGVIDEGSEEQPLLGVDAPAEDENRGEFEGFTIEIPIFEFGIIRATPSSEAESSLQATEEVDKKTAEITHDNVPVKETPSSHETETKPNVNQSEKNPSTGEVKDTDNNEDRERQNDFTSESDKKQNNIPDEETVSPDKTEEKPNGQENADVKQNNFQYKILSDSTVEQDAVFPDSTQLSDKQNSNQSERSPSDATTAEVKDTGNTEDEKLQNAFTSDKDKKQNEENKKTPQNSESNKGEPSEKSPEEDFD